MIDWNLLLSVLGLIATALGGAWALIQFYFKQQEKIEDLKDDTVQNALRGIESSVKELKSVVSVHQSNVSAEMVTLRTDIESLKVVQASHIAEIKVFGEIMAKIYRHYGGTNEPIDYSTEQVKVGKDALLIRSKNKKP